MGTVQHLTLLAAVWLEKGHPRVAAEFLEFAAHILRQEGGDRSKPRRPSIAGKWGGGRANGPHP